MRPMATENKVFPVKLTGAVKREWAPTMTDGLLWRVQQDVFDAKMELQKFLLKEDLVPCGQANIEIDIRVTQRALPYEATDGKVIDVPEELHEIIVASWNHKTWLEEM